MRKNRMVLSSIKQKKTIVLDISQKNAQLKISSQLYSLYKKYYIEKKMLDERVVLDNNRIYFELIFVSNTISLIVNSSNHQHIFCKTDFDSTIFLNLFELFT